MKVLYFNIENGECIPAYTCLPSHRAVITCSKIHSIEVSFNASNIASRGYDWFLESVEDEYKDWTNEHLNIMPSLKKLALKMSLRHPFKYSNFTPDNHRFPFVLAWINDKKYTKAYFVKEDCKNERIFL